MPIEYYRLSDYIYTVIRRLVPNKFSDYNQNMPLYAFIYSVFVRVISTSNQMVPFIKGQKGVHTH